MTNEPDASIEGLSEKQRELWKELIRVAMALCNESPAGRELAGSGFAYALQSGRATMRMEIDLPAGAVTCTAEWSEHLPEPVRLFELVPRAREYDA